MKKINIETNCCLCKRTFREDPLLPIVSEIVPSVLSSYFSFPAFLLPLSPLRTSRRPVSFLSTLEASSADRTRSCEVLSPKY